MVNHTGKEAACITMMAFLSTFLCIFNFFVLEHMNDPATLLMASKVLKLNDESGAEFSDYFGIIPQMNESQFYEDFRLSKSQFEILHEKLMYSEAFTLSCTGKASINSRKCLLIGLWVLATPDSYRSIARRFNVAKSTVLICVQRVINGLLSDVCHNAIKLPKTERERRVISRKFQNIAGMRDILGAIDCSHIEILAPVGKTKKSYFNRKKDYSLVLQAVCDAELFFIDVDVRWPGSVHDARVLRTSDLYANAENVLVNNYYLIGDPAYPLMTWLMRPYKKRHRLNRQRKKYNKVVSQTRRVIERAFGMLKQKFRRLYYLPMINMKTSVKAIVACCILHNIGLATDEYARYLIFGDQNGRLQNDVMQDLPVPVHRINAKVKRQLICDEIWQLHLRQRRQYLHNV